MGSYLDDPSALPDPENAVGWGATRMADLLAVKVGADGCWGLDCLMGRPGLLEDWTSGTRSMELHARHTALDCRARIRARGSGWARKNW